MRISRKKPNNKRVEFKKYRANQYIRSEQVRLIDENGQNLGNVPTQKALEIAQEKGLDLVEVSPLANPPVVKIVDYSKLRYQEEKERRKEKSKQKKVEVKGIRLSLRISDHDKEVRVKQAVKFLNQGDKVKIEMTLKGRERQHTDLGREIIKKFIESTNAETGAAIEQDIKSMGGKISAVIAKQ